MDLLLDFVVTAAINLTPALVIRYLIKKRPLNKKSYAVITCIIIAICAYIIAYIVAFSPNGSGLVPKGFAEEFYGVINFFMLKPRKDTTQSTSKEDDYRANSEHSEADTFTTESSSDINKLCIKPTANNMDATMEQYYDAMLPEEKKDDTPVAEPAKASKAAKISITLNVILVIALCVSTKAYVDTSTKLDVIQDNSTDKEKYEEMVDKLADQTLLADKYESIAKDYYDSAVFVNDEDHKYYHYYDCPVFDYSSYYIYNVENAEYQGYKPCSICGDIDHRMDVFY